MCFDDNTGRRTKCAPLPATGGGKKSPAKKPKQTPSQKVKAKADAVDTAKQAVEAARAGTMSRDDLLSYLGGLTSDQLDELKRHFKVRGGGRTKADKRAALAGTGNKPPAKPTPPKPTPTPAKPALVPPPNHQPMTLVAAMDLLADIGLMDDEAKINDAFQRLEDEALYVAATKGKKTLGSWSMLVLGGGTLGAKDNQDALQMVMQHIQTLRTKAIGDAGPRIKAKRQKAANDLAGQKVDLDAVDHAVAGQTMDGGPSAEERKQRLEDLERAPMKPASEVLAKHLNPLQDQRRNALNIRAYIGRVDLDEAEAEKLVSMATGDNPQELAELAQHYGIPVHTYKDGGGGGVMDRKVARQDADIRSDVVKHMVQISKDIRDLAAERRRKWATESRRRERKRLLRENARLRASRQAARMPLATAIVIDD